MIKINDVDYVRTFTIPLHITKRDFPPYFQSIINIIEYRIEEERLYWLEKRGLEFVEIIHQETVYVDNTPYKEIITMRFIKPTSEQIGD